MKYADGVRPISKEEVAAMEKARPKVTPIHPATAKDAFRAGLEAARSIMLNETAEIADPEACRILTLAFIQLNREIDHHAGRIVSGDRIDYLERVQLKARQAWVDGRMSQTTKTAVASTETPLGALICETWMEAGKDRWQSTYTLAGEQITVRQIKALGLAQRPTTRERKPK